MAVVIACGLAAAPAAHADPAQCMLILGAMPSEIGPFLEQAARPIHRDDYPTDHGNQVKSFFSSTLEGHNVVMAMTGIGTENAIETTQLALAHYSCIDGIVFSGVSGATGDENIGDVYAPSMWTLDRWVNGTLISGYGSYNADPDMIATAQDAVDAMPALTPDGHLGDCGCVGLDPHSTPPITFKADPIVEIGGPLTGLSSDPFGGNPLPCTPGTDTFGCQPCKFVTTAGANPVGNAIAAQPFATPEFFLWFNDWNNAESGSDANVVDMETGGVAMVAHDNNIPFIGFRSPSDGTQNGDPLVYTPTPFSFLPQFALYREYASEHAAQVAMAFLHDWIEPPSA